MSFDKARDDAVGYAEEQSSWVHAAARRFDCKPQMILNAVTDWKKNEDVPPNLPSRHKVLAFQEDHQSHGFLIVIGTRAPMNFKLPHGWTWKALDGREAVFDHPCGLPVGEIRRIEPLGEAASMAAKKHFP